MVRVKLRLRADKRTKLVRALVNSGFESSETEIILPPSIAKSLGVFTVGAIEDFEVAGGGRAVGCRLEKPIEVELGIKDRPVKRVKTKVTVLYGESEVIIGDRLASALGIVILDPYRGLWCLRDEFGKKSRKSAS